MKNNIFRIIIYLCIVTFFASCTSTREITKSDDLQNFSKTGEITVVSKDSIHYILNIYYLQDTVLAGKGTVETKGSRHNFNGRINLKDIRYIECEELDLTKTIIGVGAVTVISYFLIKNISREKGVNNTVVIKSPGGMGCN
jgi:hypothetical protein